MKNTFSKKTLFLVVLFFNIFFIFPNKSKAYNPPIGIPNPGMWGDIHPIDSPAPDKTVKCPTWPSGQTVNCYYVDNTHPLATDTNNIYGYPDKPRASIPTNYGAGSYVEVHGSSSVASQLIITFNCSIEEPCWFRGADEDSKPVISRETIIKGSYILLENLKIDNGYSLGLRSHNTSTLHHAIIRNSELSRVAISGHSGYSFNNIVVYNNNIHMDNFENLGPDSPEFPENDTHGVTTGSYSENVWILNNDIHDIAGDAVGNAHAANYTAKNYYVGANKLHDAGENSIDFKEIENVIISQNEMYNNYGPSSGSNGSALVVHYGPTYSPRNAWIIFNKIYNCSDSGIQIGGDVTDPVYVVGNIIHNISNPLGTAQAISSWSSDDIYLINNTLYGNDRGIDITGGNNSNFYMYNNIVANNINSSGYHLSLAYTDYRNNADLKNNIFYQPEGGVKINWGQIYDVSGLIAGTGKCEGCLESDPLFVNPIERNFGLQSTSPAIDAGISTSVYNLFESLFGESIDFDFIGTIRPQNLIWDIGTHEYVEFVDTTSPNAPVNLSVL
ncbi:MAG: right-handed parallel beta-helix repeat-containing protein [Candidatus Moraniibacteriota bacterium]